MKNVTVSMDEDVARWARIWAAEHQTSVSRLIGAMLKERMAEAEGYDAARRAYLAQRPRRLTEGGRYPTRAEIHER